MNRSGIRLRVDITPVHLAGLEFHHPVQAVDAAMKIAGK